MISGPDACTSLGVRVLFVLPRSSWSPIGALKVIYSYADGLADAGHEVLLVHGHRAGSPVVDPHPWYVSRPGVRSVVMPGLATGQIGGRYDVVVATSWQVVPVVERSPDRLGRKVAFFQDCESYYLGTSAEKVAIERSAGTGWPTIAGSEPVRRLYERFGVGSRLVACGVDTERFHVQIPLDHASRVMVGFPARDEQAKRTADAVAAISSVQAGRRGVLPVWTFGAYRAGTLPGNIAQYVQPTDRELAELYNRTAVFVVPSEMEGFGFAGVEAMACGAALVSTANGGVDAYARDRKSALLCPPGDPGALATAIGRLLDDDRLRMGLAHNGVVSATTRTVRHAQGEFARTLFEVAAL